MVAKVPAPCFYVSAETAFYQYRLYKKGRSNIKDNERRKMFAEIFVRYENLLKDSAGTMYKYAIMEAVLAQQAPSYYLTDETSIFFYYNARRKKRKRIKEAC